MNLDVKQLRPLVDADSMIYASIAVAKKNADDDGLEEVPLGYACQALKKTFDSVLQRTDRDDAVFYLQGANNFRKTIAKILPYKGNRPPKPPLFEETRNYAVRKLGAILVDGMEAEDKVAIEYNNDPANSVMYGIDKDLLQVPGYHFNYKTGEFKTISKLEGNLRLWSQILTGDATDSILGIPGTGPARAEVLLQGVRSYRQGWDACASAYQMAFKNQLCKQEMQPNGKLKWVFEKGSGLQRHDGYIMSWREALIETGKLIYLLRHEWDEFKTIGEQNDEQM